ncbi:hypothetical protein ALC60_14186, partial [Trachymyrmex zeteki]
AAQKLNLSSSPHRRRRSGDENIGSDELPIFPNGYAALLLKSPPPAPPALLRRIGVKELTGVGKKTSCLQLRVAAYSSLSSPTFERVLPECQRDFAPLVAAASLRARRKGSPLPQTPFLTLGMPNEPRTSDFTQSLDRTSHPES